MQPQRPAESEPGGLGAFGELEGRDPRVMICCAVGLAHDAGSGVLFKPKLA